MELGSLLSVKVNCMLHWSSSFLLCIVGESIKSSNTISIINICQINGMDISFSCNKYNTLMDSTE
jgi:hypothetical protein